MTTLLVCEVPVANSELASDQSNQYGNCMFLASICAPPVSSLLTIFMKVSWAQFSGRRPQDLPILVEENRIISPFKIMDSSASFQIADPSSARGTPEDFEEPPPPEKLQVKQHLSPYFSSRRNRQVTQHIPPSIHCHLVTVPLHLGRSSIIDFPHYLSQNPTSPLMLNRIKIYFANP